MVSEICIAGGGPAGLAAALALNSRGFRVTVIDCAIPPIDKACGEGLMPDSMAALRQLGVCIPEAEGHPFKGILFTDGKSTVAGDFPNGSGFGMRRTVLHQLMVKHAEAAGIRLVWGAKDVRLHREGLTANGTMFRAEFVVGADGQKSLVRSTAALDGAKRERRRYGFRRHYRLAPWSEYVELYWGRRSQIYITPVASDEVCVAVISRHAKLRLDEALCDFRALQQRLNGAPQSSPEMGAISVSRQLKRVYRDGLALLGDASGSVDAITGEGLCLAFKQSLALAEALQTGNLRHYAERHREISAKPRLMADLMLSMEWHHNIQRKALASLANQPEFFARLLEFHVIDKPWSNLFSRQLLRFGLDFLAA